MFSSKDDLREFVGRLRIPESRKQLVEQELLDHVESRIAAELAVDASPVEAERVALAALGDPDVLRASLERIEPSFEIDPRHAMLRGLASAVSASVVFVVLGELLPPRGPGFVINLVVGSGMALCGLAVMWLLAPRGMGPAIWAEARASVARPIEQSPRRRAVKGYLGSIVLVHVIAMAMHAMGIELAEHILRSWGCLGLAYGPYALYVMRTARTDRAIPV